MSIEASIEAVGDGVNELGMLYRLGYRQFKISNQGANGRVRCPSPPLEGLYVDQRFDGQMSGPFGEEIPGRWMDFNETLAKYRWLMRVRAAHGLEERGATPRGAVSTGAIATTSAIRSRGGISTANSRVRKTALTRRYERRK